ncbi:hypothetical protein C8R44DRAFT_866619 [Mycena epipterygia]|nr:hypothetical protein C8R44DRAFT_866619 [Mycena epipterygia]
MSPPSTLQHDEIDTFTKPSLLELLHDLPPTLQHLRIQDTQDMWTSYLDDDVLAVLTPPPGLPASCCSALQSLVIHRCKSISTTAVVLFITVRMNEPRPTLKRIDIQFSRPADVDIMPSLQPFIET